MSWTCTHTFIYLNIVTMIFQCFDGDLSGWLGKLSSKERALIPIKSPKICSWHCKACTLFFLLPIILLKALWPSFEYRFHPTYIIDVLINISESLLLIKQAHKSCHMIHTYEYLKFVHPSNTSVACFGLFTLWHFSFLILFPGAWIIFTNVNQTQ